MMTFLTGSGEELGLNASLCKVMGNLYSLQGEQDYKVKYHPLATSENMLAGHDKPPGFHKAPTT